MARKAASGFDFFFWRSRTSRAVPPAGTMSLDGPRMMAEQRAAAAEIIANEANALRLKALLDAAREQDTARTIQSAEARFAAAKSEWEAVRQGLRAEPDPYAEIDVRALPSVEDRRAPTRAPSPVAWLPKLAAVARSRSVSLGVLFVALLVGSVGGVYLHSVEKIVTEEAQVAQPSPTPPAAAEDAAPANAVPAAAAPQKKSPPRIVRVPRVRPGQEPIAVRVPAKAERPPRFPNIE
jgi:hypothetical protein